MKISNLIVAFSLLTGASAYANSHETTTESQEPEAIAHEDIVDFEQDLDYSECIDRKETTKTQTARQGITGGRKQKYSTYTYETEQYGYFIVSESVRLWNISHIGSGRGCEGLEHLRKPGAPDITGLRYSVHARSDGPGSKGAEVCGLRWKECKK